ncbi:MAG: hypothetical protein QOD42_3105 [Sphingomonadales bacterium]|jgi:hypothetical protein|nr:hypothetical protein [Sphingomonadales bacterium]
MNYRVPLIALAAALAAGAAAANDSTAVTAAGGLVLTRNDDIDMVSEDLFVSVEQVRVHYVFRNRSRRDISVTVAFPMPDRELSQLGHADVGYPSDFHTMVAGRPVRAALERHAVASGRDRTALLESLRIPLAPDAEGIAHISAALAALPAARQAELRRLGLLGNDEYDESRIVPTWTLRDTWHWRQVFPAGRDLVVDHRYRPGAGSSPGPMLGDRAYRRTADGRGEMAAYCPDRAFLARLERLTVQGGDGTQRGDYRLGYILTTGGNWRSPIGTFRLVVDKGRASNIVSFCETGVRRLNATQFEVRHRNWRPTRNLDILIAQTEE